MLTPETVKESRALVAQIRATELYRTYAGSFQVMTSLPLALRPVEALDLPHHEHPHENRFCRLMTRDGQNCARCLEMQRCCEEEGARQGRRTFACFAGLSESSVPVHLGERVIGYLRTGQVMLHAPSHAQFARLWPHLQNQDGATDLEFSEAEAAYLGTRVLETRQYEAAVQLLAIFSQHLSTLAAELTRRAETAEPPSVTRARVYIGERFGEQLSLETVARAASVSPFHFCKVFKDSTGMTFTQYLANTRIEKAKALLRDPQRRISDVAFEVGFQSLSQFNRVFRSLSGQTPTRFRDQPTSSRVMAVA